MKKILKITVCFLLLLNTAQAIDPCIQEVKDCYRKLAELGKTPLGKKVYYMSYTVKSTPVDSLKKSSSSSTIQMWMNRDGVVIKSKEMEVYQDSVDVFTLLRPQKMVLRSQPLPSSSRQKSENRFTMIQDTLFALSTVKQCKQEGTTKTVVLEPTSFGQDFLNIRQISFVINTQLERIERVIIQYTTQYSQEGKEALANVQYTFNDFSLDYKGIKPAHSVKKRFIKDNKLTEEFMGYKYMDNRKK